MPQIHRKCSAFVNNVNITFTSATLAIIAWHTDFASCYCPGSQVWLNTWVIEPSIYYIVMTSEMCGQAHWQVLQSKQLAVDWSFKVAWSLWWSSGDVAVTLGSNVADCWRMVFRGYCAVGLCGGHIVWALWRSAYTMDKLEKKQNIWGTGMWVRGVVLAAGHHFTSC